MPVKVVVKGAAINERDSDGDEGDDDAQQQLYLTTFLPSHATQASQDSRVHLPSYLQTVLLLILAYLYCVL